MIQEPIKTPNRNKKMFEMYNKKMADQIVGQKDEMMGMHKDLLGHIDNLKKETNQAIRERDAAQMELKSLQGQYNNHLQQNEIFKENMEHILKANSQQQVNGFLVKYANNDKNHNVYDIKNSDTFGNDLKISDEINK